MEAFSVCVVGVFCCRGVDWDVVAARPVACCVLHGGGGGWRCLFGAQFFACACDAPACGLCTGSVLVQPQAAGVAALRHPWCGGCFVEVFWADCDCRTERRCLWGVPHFLRVGGSFCRQQPLQLRAGWLVLVAITVSRVSLQRTVCKCTTYQRMAARGRVLCGQAKVSCCAARPRCDQY